MIDQEKIEAIAKEYCLRRDLARREATNDAITEFNRYKNFAITHFKPLVEIRSSRYKKFPNHPDLEQDGYEALMLALNSFDPKKGSFTWWADKYIATRISRAANNHSVIHIPIKQARDIKPTKIMSFPLMVDPLKDPSCQSADLQMEKIINGFIDRLDHPEIIRHVYGIHSNRLMPTSIKSAMERFNLTRAEIMIILRSARERLIDMIIQLT